MFWSVYQSINVGQEYPVWASVSYGHTFIFYMKYCTPYYLTFPLSHGIKKQTCITAAFYRLQVQERWLSLHVRLRRTLCTLQLWLDVFLLSQLTLFEKYSLNKVFNFFLNHKKVNLCSASYLLPPLMTGILICETINMCNNGHNLHLMISI